ncbi:MAG: hypothetical protein AAFR98_07340 [Pseudomonadota bacterium]
MKRRSLSKGFSLVEALVSIGVASMTILMLTGGIWGLRLIADNSAGLNDSAADWMAARRALHAWTAGLSSRGNSDADGRFEGTSNRAQMVIEPYATSSPQLFVGDLQIKVEDGIYTLEARRHFSVRDTRIDGENPQVSTILISDEPIRLVYLLPARTGAGSIWRYETQASDGIPIAIGIERGSERIITARSLNSVSASCVGALGPAGVSDNRCEIR